LTLEVCQGYKKLMDERLQHHLEQLGAGCATWDIYNQCVGVLIGLKEAIKLADDADFEINGGS
jgi:hypothetical protein